MPVKISGKPFKIPREFEPAKMQQKLHKHLVRAAEEIAEQGQRIVMDSIPGPYIGSRSGDLRGSVQKEVMPKLGNVQAIVGSEDRLPYGRIHELGGTIRPVKRKWLTIPLKAAMTETKMSRGPARSFENTFFQTVGGKLFLFQKMGKALIPLFLLVKEVTLPPRQWLSGPLTEENSERTFTRLWQKGVGRFVKDAIKVMKK